MKVIILFTSKLKYGVFLSLKMLVYNRYTYTSLGFKVIIYYINQVLVHASSYSMLNSMILVPFNTNIITILYILVYILSEKNLNILQSLSCILLELYMIQNNKILVLMLQWQLRLELYGSFIYDIYAVIFITIIIQTILLSESDLWINKKITSRSSKNNNNNTMKIFYKHPSLPQVTS